MSGIVTKAQLMRQASVWETISVRVGIWTRWASTLEGKGKSLALPATSRINEIGIQSLSEELYRRIFPNGAKSQAPKHLVDLAKEHLTRHDLLGKNTDGAGPIAFEIPGLIGATKTLDEHFTRLGQDASDPYLDMASTFAIVGQPAKPSKWHVKSGWTKYIKDGYDRLIPVAVEAPEDNILCFDTEVLWKQHPYAIMACAMSATHWYSWLSPWLLGETEDPKQLIPLGDPKKDRLVVGHNVGYDRARIKEEYDLKQTRNFFMDTMSLHVAVNGMCSQQRPTWMKYRKNRELQERYINNPDDEALAQLMKDQNLNEEEELWVEHSSINSLRDVAQFHLKLAIDKTVRDDFGTLDREGVLNKLQDLLQYCAADVVITHKVYRLVFPNFLETCPHPVSFAALRHISSVILPVNKSWNKYIETAESTYMRMNKDVLERLQTLATKALEVKDQPDVYNNDPWLSQLDWSGQAIKMTKGTKKDPPRPVARQKMPGMPQWYKDLFPKTNGPINLTVRTRVAPILLRLCWEGHPLIWSDKYGWVFKVKPSEADTYEQKQVVRCVFDEAEGVEALLNDPEGYYYKLPHKDGPNARCTNPMAKSYLAYFENGTLSSEYPYAKEALEMNASCSYWISARDRIKSQMVVFEEYFKGKDAVPDLGYIIPQIIPMGTITRRAVENTWLTASNAKKNRVGSELKAMVQAPEGYCFVGADVDSEELWIASLVGDATFRLHGGNAIGFMTLEGTKAAGTDMHSRTASILGITRNDAKVFNYGRIYGAGLKFAATLLRRFNPSLSEKQITETAGRLYENTKGQKTNRKAIYRKAFWRGGTESFVFNKLENFAEQPRPRTFVLGAGITEALISRYVSKGGYLTSRINWAIQSSGVDYLHLLITGMDYLIRRFNIDARLAITVHDEIRYLVRLEDRYRAAMALQIANLWTRAMFAEQVDILDLPQAVAFFSAVDIDSVLRKEVDMDCITPSHKTPIPHGESINMYKLLDKGAEAYLNPAIKSDPAMTPHPEKYPYTPRTSIMKQMFTHFSDDKISASGEITFIKAQISASDAELNDIIKEKMNAMSLASVVDGTGLGSSAAANLKAAAADSLNRPKGKGKYKATGRSTQSDGIKRGRGRPMSVTPQTFIAPAKAIPDKTQFDRFRMMYASGNPSAVADGRGRTAHDRTYMSSMGLPDPEFEKWIPAWDGPPIDIKPKKGGRK